MNKVDEVLHTAQVNAELLNALKAALGALEEATQFLPTHEARVSCYRMTINGRALVKIVEGA